MVGSFVITEAFNFAIALNVFGNHCISNLTAKMGANMSP